MENKKYIYLVFSSSDLKMGKVIRKVTGEKYNHVSVSLDPKLQILYSFARHHFNTPFYGGFVCETAIRYCWRNRNADIKVYAIPVRDLQLKKAAEYLYEKNNNSDKYLYNMVSAVFTPLHKKISIGRAYTCIEFATDILTECGITDKLVKNKFYSLSDLQDIFNEYQVYEGKYLKDEAESYSYRDTYIIKRNIAMRTYLTIAANTQLMGLLLKGLVTK